MARPLLPPTPDLAADAATLRERLLDYFRAVYERYEELFEVLSCDEAYYVKPIPLRHPLIFYYGHTATFFVNKLLLAGLIRERIDPRFESIFAVGVDEMSWDDLDDTHYGWPARAEVQAYRDTVRTVVETVICTAPISEPITWESPLWAVMMGIEHELIHLETSSVLIRQHALRYVRPHPAWEPCRLSGDAPANTLVAIPGGTVRLGKNHDDPYYGWDNEYGSHEAAVAAFEAGRYPVTNREFLDFVEDGGYTNDAYWDEEGDGWRTFARPAHPTFWIPAGETWHLRLMTQEIPMPWDWPVEVNQLEAAAFCRWKQAKTARPYRLPTEDEYARMCALSPADAPANVHLSHFASSCPVTMFPHGELYDLRGNVWQWTSTAIYPFDGFAVHPLYDDFTTPTFDDRHAIFKGGSWISCGNEARDASRYAFRRHFFQHAGFRYVVGEKAPLPPSSRYETDEQLSQYAEFHYGDDYFGVPNFPQALARLALAATKGRPTRRALDIGCAAGRSTVELARRFDRVTGVDFSARFIGLGVTIATTGALRYTLVDEGELVSYKERRLADLGLEAHIDRVEFFQGDACNLKPIFTGYDLVLAANLIDRLYSPRRFLETIHERIVPGGLLVLASPYTWVADHTDRSQWLGGFKKDGESFTTLDGLHAILDPRFRLVGDPVDLPFVLRETARKFQHTVSQVTIWERRA